MESEVSFAGGAKVARPLDVSIGADQVAAALVGKDRDGRGAKLATLAAPNGQDAIRAHRETQPQEAGRQRVGPAHKRRGVITGSSHGWGVLGHVSLFGVVN